MANGSTSGTGSTKAREKRMIDALISLSLKVARKVGDDTDIEARIEAYAADLMAWPEKTAMAVIDEHPRRSIFWPAWKELEDLRGEFEAAERDRRLALPDPNAPETFAQRVTRLKL